MTETLTANQNPSESTGHHIHNLINVNAIVGCKLHLKIVNDLRHLPLFGTNKLSEVCFDLTDCSSYYTSYSCNYCSWRGQLLTLK